MKIPLPYDLQIEITTHCNLRCVMCKGAHPEGEEEPRHLSFERFKHVADQMPNLYRLTPQGGGESLLHPDISEIVQYGVRRGAFVAFNTNATLLDEEWAVALVQSGMHRLTASVDAASSELYERIRSGASLERVVANLKTFQRVKRAVGVDTPKLWLAAVIMKRNYRQAPAIMRLAGEVGAEIALFSPVNLNNLPEQAGLQRCTAEEWAHLWQMCAALTAECEVGLISMFRDVGAIEWRFGMCAFPWYSLYVSLEGYVHPCCYNQDWGGTLGNVFEESLEDIWYGEKYRQVREQLLQPGIAMPEACAACPFQGVAPSGPWGE